MARPPMSARIVVAVLCRHGWPAAAATVDGASAGAYIGMLAGAYGGMPVQSPSMRGAPDAGGPWKDATEAGASSGAPSLRDSALFDFGSVLGGIAAKIKDGAEKAKDEAGHLTQEAKQKAGVAATDVAQDVKKDAAEAEQKVVAAMRVHRSLLEKENGLGGNSKAFNNMLLLTLLGGVALAAFAGHVLEMLFGYASRKVGGSHSNEVPLLCEEHPCRGSGHPRGWVVGVLIASYAMLVPAVQSTLFSFNIFVSLHVDFVGDVGYNLTRHPVTESTFSVIGVLFKTGGHLAACLVILYAMVLPAAKVLLLLVGELWRNSADEARRRVSSTCIGLVQVVSKWATPDLFAYVLLLFLARHLSHPPLIEAEGLLDAGFCCFGVFCLCSTFSTLAIHRPPSAEESKGPAQARCPACGRAPDPAPLLLAGKSGASKAVVALEVVFVVLLVLGLFTPCMGLHLDAGLLLEPKGPVPRSMGFALKDAIHDLGLQPLLRAEVSLWHCLAALWGYMAEGEAACAMAFVMLAGFALLLTAVDMLLLALATFLLGRPSSKMAMAASRVVKHISMLDVLCMGVFVVCMAGEAYRSVGFNLGLRLGLLPLVGAEVVHYATYYLVVGAVGEREEEEGCCADHSAPPDELSVE